MYNPYTIGIPPQIPSNPQFNQMGYNFMPQPQQMQQNAPQSDATYVLPVASVKDFDNVTIQPGRRALLMAQNEPYIAFKAADAMGMVQTSLYKIEPVTADQMGSPSEQYATKTELSQLQQVVQQIVESLTPKNPTTKKEDKTE